MDEKMKPYLEKLMREQGNEEKRLDIDAM